MSSSVDLDKFNKLSPSVKDEYLAMGRHLKEGIWDVLTSEQRNIYINSGAWIFPGQLKDLSESQLKRYNKLAWRKIENKVINSGGSLNPNMEEKNFLENFSFSEILKSDMNPKAQKAIADYYLINKLYSKITDEDLINIVNVSPQLLQHVKGLTMNQMKMVSKHIQTQAKAKSA